jgi:hypothetical protein
MSELEEIGFRYGTDKSRICHNYLPTYEQFFAPARHGVITLLELGVQDGYSLRTWREYFTKATIVGVDCGPPLNHRLPNTFVYQCDQADPRLPGLLARHCPLDIIIDDASHLSVNTIASFRLLWPLLAPGGVYIIEDLACHDDTAALAHIKDLTWHWGHPGQVSAERMAQLYYEAPSEYAFIRLSRNLAIIGKTP